MNRELFDTCMKDAKDLLKPHISKAYLGDDDLLIHLAFILFKHRLKEPNYQTGVNVEGWGGPNIGFNGI